MVLKKNMARTFGAYSIVLVFFLSQFTLLNASQMSYQDDASEVIMHSLSVNGKKRFLSKLYKRLFYVPLWMHENALSSSGKALFKHVKNDSTLDKKGKLYKNSLSLEKEARSLYLKPTSVAKKIDLEFKISQLYEAYTNYAYLGSINWGAFSARISNLMVNDVSTEWVLHRPNVNALRMAESAALGGNLSKKLANAMPKKYHYRALRKALVKYRKIQEQGGWLPVKLKGTLKPGMRAAGVRDLRERLRKTSDYKSCSDSAESTQYDKCLQIAVKRFQKRNGLPSDGAVGAGTLKVLNQSVGKRITTILLNLDRIKWLKKRTAKRRVIINIPAFMLYFEEDGKLRQTIKTVVGRPNHPTPIFSNIVKTIVLNPYWNLPQSIIQKEMIPKLLRNRNAMKRKGIEIYTGWGKDAKKISARSVNWAQYRYSKRVPFRFAQVPGPRNALGKLKFLFPNKYAVYMHDTPAKKLFSRSKRAFSHGCIRLHKPRELLKTFASFNSNISFKKSQKILKGKVKTYMALKEPVPVDVIYLTAWVDYDGKLQFRNDIYNYDKMQLKSFRKW